MSSDTFVFEDTMTMELDTEGMTAEEVMSGGGGGAVNAEGWYHLCVTKLTRYEEENKLPCIRVDMQAVGVNPSQADQMGKHVFHRLYLRSWHETGGKDEKGHPIKEIGPLSDGAKKGLVRFALGMKIADSSLVGTPNFRIAWSALEGCQCVALVKKETRKGADGKEIVDYRIPYNEVFPVDSEQAKNCTMNPDYLALLQGAGIDESLIEDL